ncbi:hypothetical protein [Streptomyces platensis]|uniref:hypothetical protein n=1 Tax=Streptomyces platensis TaxID=58346 RepID=UPI002E81D4B9|nr:hypothetical protein [Streptomyces platensis]WUB79303.1 hypothetical protein OG424_09025 [Streptomyces platensis]
MPFPFGVVTSPDVLAARRSRRQVDAAGWPLSLTRGCTAGMGPDRPVPPMAGTAAIGAFVRLPATAIEEGRDLSSMCGILADTAYRLVPA